jgi:hypothetical protein
MLDDLLKKLDGKKTYLSALGLAALAVTQFMAGDYPGAAQSLLAALAAFGLRQAMQKMEAHPAEDEPEKKS